MRGFSIPSALTLIFWALQPGSLQAGGVERLLFTDSGTRIFSKLGDEVPENPLVLSSKVNSSCIEAPGQTCVFWKLAISPEMQAMEILPEILTGFNLWSQETSLNVAFLYNGVTNSAGIPYEIVPGSNPEEILVDEFGNEVISGNFLVSLLPPEDFVFPPGVVATTVKYVVPNLTTGNAETRWAGIYLNPAYDPDEDYQLERVIASEAGILLGLSGSLDPNSIMNPSLSAGAQALGFTDDDLQWARTLYPSAGSPTDIGSMSGRAILGSDGSALKGVSVFLISADKENAFANSADWDLIKYQSFTGPDGHFQFPQLPAGDYFAVMAGLEDWGIGREFFDDWMNSFSYHLPIGIEFYDGAGAESNHEGSLTFSPQLIHSAAIIRVVAGAETSNVEIISNSANPQDAEIKAVGSSNEVVRAAGFDLEERLKKLYDAEAAFPLPQKKGGGCGVLHSDRGLDSFSLFLGFFALFLVALSAMGLRKE